MKKVFPATKEWRCSLDVLCLCGEGVQLQSSICTVSSLVCKQLSLKVAYTLMRGCYTKKSNRRALTIVAGLRNVLLCQEDEQNRSLGTHSPDATKFHEDGGVSLLHTLIRETTPDTTKKFSHRNETIMLPHSWPLNTAPEESRQLYTFLADAGATPHVKGAT